MPLPPFQPAIPTFNCPMDIYHEDDSEERGNLQAQDMKKSENDTLEEGERAQPTEQQNKIEKFECFCSNQYLSYSALYNHLKVKHLEFFELNRQFYFTNSITIIDPVHGYQIKKILKEKVIINSDQLGRKKKTRNPNVPNVDRRLRPQYEFEAIQVETAERLKRNEAKKRLLHINEKMLEKESELLEELEGMMESYEDTLRLLGIQEISEALKMKLEDFQESSEEEEEHPSDHT